MAGGWCYVKELVQPHVAQQFADTRARRDSLRLPQLRVERRDAPPAHRPQRADRGLPERHLVRRDARRGRRRADRRVGALLQRRPLADPRRHRPAREVRRRRRSRSSTAIATCDASTGRSASAASSSCSWTTGGRASPAARTDSCPHAAPDPAAEVSTWPFPETYETFLDAEGSARPRPTRTGARSNPPSC